MHVRDRIMNDSSIIHHTFIYHGISNFNQNVLAVLLHFFLRSHHKPNSPWDHVKIAMK